MSNEQSTASDVAPTLVEVVRGNWVESLHRGAYAVVDSRGATLRGAEGVFCAALPRLGLGVALKIADGASRAAEFAIISLLDSLGYFDTEQRRALQNHLAPRFRTSAGVSAGWLHATRALVGLHSPTLGEGNCPA